MSFLYPQFLFGLFAISIPILIHLFNFQKPKKVLFTNVQYLKNVKEITNNRLKLKHLLILLCRIAFVIFLVLAFAQPFIHGDNAAAMNGKPDVYFYLDNSFSMQNETQGDKALDAANKAVVQLRDVYAYNTDYNLLTNDFEGRDQYMLNKDKLAERLTEISYSNISRDGSAINKRITSLTEKTGKRNNHIFWLTDFQKSTMGDLGRINFDTNAQYYLVPVQGENTANIFVDSVWVGNPMVRANENNVLEAVLSNSGDKEVNDLVLKLIIDNIQSSSASISIAAHGSQKVQFNFNLSSGGSKKCKITFEDFPVTFDNEYYFVLNASPRIKVLHLYNQDGAYVKQVYSNSNVFELHSSQVGDFDYSLISVADLLVLDGLEEIPVSLAKALKGFIRKGGSLLLYPSGKANIVTYNSFLKEVYLPAVVKLNADTALTKVNATLSAPDFSNPFFKDVFEKEDKAMDMPYAYPVIGWQNKGERLLSYKNGDAFLSLFKAGKGAIYLAAAPLEKSYTNFQRHGAFLPVMYKVAFQSISAGEKMAHTFQDPGIAVEVGAQGENSVYSLSSGKFKVIPEQRLNGRQLIFDLPNMDLKPGFYNLMLGDTTLKTLAFNSSRKESFLECYSPEALQKSVEGKKNVHIYKADTEKFLDDFRKKNVGESWWKYCLMVSLLFLLAEVLLIRFY